MSITAMKQALEALEEACGDRCNAEYNPCHARIAITSLRQAIEQAEKREWVGLTGEEIQQVFIANSVMVDNGNTYMVAGLRAVNIGRAIEAKLKEKNT